MNRGFMQNLAILLLVLSSIVLLSIRFELFVLSGGPKTLVIEDKSTLRYSVRPSSITLRIGAENATKIIDKNGLYYMEVARILEESIQNRTGIVAIDPTEYRAIKGSKSIQLNFEPAINQRLLYGSLFLEDGRLGDFGSIKEILVPQAYNTSIYFSTNDNKFMEIKSPSINTLPNFDNYGSLGYTKYYSIGERFPEFTDNDVLISDEARLSSYVTESMFNEGDMDSLVRGIFGSKYDYANKISEIDGSTIVNYDYGREVIKISPNGKVFYFNAEASVGNNRVSMAEAVSNALGFMSALTGDQAHYVLEGIADYKADGNTGYEITMSRRMDGIRISYKNDNPPIRITVVNGKVLSMEGLFRTPVTAVDNNLAFGENVVLFMLEKNFDYIRNMEPFDSTGDLFDKIHSVEYAYIYSKEYNYIACYKMVIGDSTFFFKIEDGEVIH